jgi:hypothetical protein
MKRVPVILLSGLGILLSWQVPAGLAQSFKPGTEIRVLLVDKLDTAEAKDGQTFSATLAEPVKIGSGKTLERGTRVNGQVIEAVSSGRLKRPASLTLTLTSVDKTPIHTEALQIDGKSHAGRDTALIGGGAVAGAILGAIAGGGKGAVIGTAVGAGAGTGTAYATGKQEIVLRSESDLTFVVAGRPDTATRTPEPVVERNIDRDPEPKPARWRDNSREDRDDAYDALIFSEHDKFMIRSYFQSNHENLPPGLAKRGGNLPPGLEKRMSRDGVLPPGLQKRVEPLPEDLERELPRLPSGHSRVVLSGRVMILADDGRIVDLMFIYR